MTPSDTLRVMLMAGLVSTVPLRSGTPEFKHLVKDLRTQYHKAPIGTGFLGFLARCFSPEGVRGLRLAVFEDPEARYRLPGADFEGLVRKTMGPELTPMVLVRSQRTGERTLIYAKPRGKRTELLIAMADHQDVVVMSLEVDPERLQAWLDAPDQMGKRARGEKQPVARADSKAKETNAGLTYAPPAGGSVSEVEMVR